MELQFSGRDSKRPGGAIAPPDPKVKNIRWNRQLVEAWDPVEVEAHNLRCSLN
jgi:hypothetical protein